MLFGASGSVHWDESRASLVAATTRCNCDDFHHPAKLYVTEPRRVSKLSSPNFRPFWADRVRDRSVFWFRQNAALN